MGTKQRDKVFYRDLHREYPVLVRGEGIYLYDSDGRRYIDGAGGALVCSLGHGNREMAEHMRGQAERLAFVPIARFTHAPQAELADRLSRLGHPDLPYSYFVSGGSEAMETAIKMARQYHLERDGRSSRFLVIGRYPGYHGNTLACLSIGGNASRRRPYEPYLFPSPKLPVPHCASCAFHLGSPSCDLECANALEREIFRAGAENVSCFVAETITGASGGVIPPPPGYLARVAEICRRHGVLFIADEIMCGSGRTGRFLACSHFDAMPDILVLGKGITAGYSPLAAVLVSNAVYDVFEKGTGAFINNYTFAANPLSCAMACKALEILERDRLMPRAAAAGERLRERLRGLARRHPVLGKDIRGSGLMIGVDLFRDRDRLEPFPRGEAAGEKLTRACLQEGLVIYPGLLALAGDLGDCFLLGPPLNITEEESEELVAALDRALARSFPS